MKTKQKQIVWTIILTASIVIFLLTGCKPKQIITERIVTKVDSVAVLKLQERLNEKVKEIEDLKVYLNRLREENTRLQSEVSTHTIKYDTTAQVKLDGQYPKASETITNSKQLIENAVMEFEDVKANLMRENNRLITKKVNLEYENKQLRNENSELRSKTVPTTGFNFRLVFLSFISGIGLSVLFFMRTKIKGLLWKK